MHDVYTDFGKAVEGDAIARSLSKKFSSWRRKERRVKVRERRHLMGLLWDRSPIIFYE